MKIKYFILIISISFLLTQTEELVYREYTENGSLNALIDDYTDELYLIQLDLLNDSLVNRALEVLPNLELYAGPSSYHRLITPNDYLRLEDYLTSDFHKIINDNYNIQNTREYWTQTIQGNQYSSSSGEVSSSCMCIDGPDCVVVGFNDSWYNPFDYYGEASWSFNPPPSDEILEVRVYVAGSQCDDLPIWSETNLSVKNNDCGWSDFQVSLSIDNTVNGPYIISDQLLDQIWCNGSLQPVIGSEDNYNVDWVQIELYYSCVVPENNLNINASDNEYCDYIDISWETGEDILGYNLYRDNNFIASFDNDETQFTDYLAASNTIHEYCLTMINDCGESDVSCNYGSRKTVPNYTESIIASESFTNQILISWLETEDTEYYNLYRDGFLLSVLPNNIIEYIDIFVDSDIDYEYCAESVNDCGNSDWNCDVGSLSIGDIGDVNLDQAIDILDVINVLNFVLEQTVPTETEFWLSDINSDGVLNILDLVQLVNIILG